MVMQKTRFGGFFVVRDLVAENHLCASFCGSELAREAVQRTAFASKLAPTTSQSGSQPLSTSRIIVSAAAS